MVKKPKAHRVTARNIRYVGAGDKTFRRNSRLLLARPTPTALHTADHLDPPAAPKSNFYVLSTVLSTMLIIVTTHFSRPDQPKNRSSLHR